MGNNLGNLSLMQAYKTTLCCLLTLFTLTGCSTNMTYQLEDLIQEQKESASHSVFIESNREKIDQTVATFIDVFQRYEQQELAQSIPDLYSSNAFLNDRIHSVRGMEKIAQYFDSTFEKMNDSDFTIHETIYGAKDVYLRWTMRIQLKESSPYHAFIGMSQFRFNEEGKIIYHQDYWDFSEILSTVRFVRSIVNIAKSRA